MSIKLKLLSSRICNYFPSGACTRCASLGTIPVMIDSGYTAHPNRVKLTPLQSCWGLATQIFLDCPLGGNISQILDQGEGNTNSTGSVRTGL